MLKFAFCVVLFFLWTEMPIAAGSFAVGGQVSSVERDFSFLSGKKDSENGESFLAFLAFDMGNSMFYIKHHKEDVSIEVQSSPLMIGFEMQESSISWNWNESTSKDNYIGTGLELFKTDYLYRGKLEVQGFPVEDFEEDFFGLGIGLKGTRFLVSRTLFITGDMWLRIPFAEAQDDKNLENSFITGFEGHGALGIAIGGNTNFAIKAGYRYRQINFKEHFFDDQKSEIFIAFRLFFSQQ